MIIVVVSRRRWSCGIHPQVTQIGSAEHIDALNLRNLR
jgi:hypothetical protein